MVVVAAVVVGWGGRAAAKGRGRGRMFVVEGAIDKGEDLAASQHLFFVLSHFFRLPGLSSDFFQNRFFHRNRCKAMHVFICLGYWSWENCSECYRCMC